MKNIISLATALLLFTAIHAAAEPVAGVAFISSDSARGAAVADLLEKHIIEILKTRTSIKPVGHGIIGRELRRFRCLEEKCILRFAQSADIGLIIRGSIKDRGSRLRLKLLSQSTGFPQNGKILASYIIDIPLNITLSPREFSLISEEHAGRFLARTLGSYRHAVKIVTKNGKTHTLTSGVRDGEHILFSEYGSSFYRKTGRIKIKDSTAEPVGKTVITDKSFILENFMQEGNSIEAYYSSRKKEIVFTEDSWKDTLYMFFLTAPASATMPVAAPVLGYFANDDWQGLGLWAVNCSPWLSIEGKGLIDSPARLKEKNEDITRDDRAMNWFAWYMVFAGGTPLFVDAFSHEYLRNASYFRGRQELMGSPLTAAYLSLVSNGGGHFYRGSRFWGYFYFHLNNSLLYLTLREYARPEEYDHTSERYVKGKRNSRKAAVYGTVLALSKTVEIIHSIMSGDSIRNGQEIQSGLSGSPYFALDEKEQPVYGFSVAMPF